MKAMKITTSLLLCVALLGFLAGCIQSGNSETKKPNASPPSDAALFEQLFNIENTVTVSLHMSDEELAKMQADYEKYDCNGSKSPVYRMGNLHITITTPDQGVYTYSVEEVGVRMKGNTSRTAFYNEEEGIYNLIHLKLSFQETFDDPAYYGTDCKEWTAEERAARKSRTFATLEKIDLRWNRCDDSTYLKEYFAYETYREYGVPAPHVNLCSFDWSGNHMGIFTINEPVDEIFLSKYLAAEALGGDLYKVGWAGSNNGSFTRTSSIGVEDEDARRFYAYDLKTNKKTSTHASLTGFIRALSGEVSKEAFADLVDLDSFLPYCAVSYLLGNPDDLRNNYNNCYIYFRADNGKMLVIPYDYDRCLGVTTHWNPTGDGVTSDNPFSATLNADGSQQQSPLFLHSVVAGGHYVREYAAILASITSGTWFTFDHFASLYAIAEANYGNLTAPSKIFYNAAGLNLTFDLERTSDFSSNGNISFREYLQAKSDTLAWYLSDLSKYADASPNIPAAWYIRCDASNWQNDTNYAMTVENGLVTIRLTIRDQLRLKVYHDPSGRWFGAECIASNCTVPFGSDGHTNIILSAGTYTLTFDPETETISLTKH